MHDESEQERNSQPVSEGLRQSLLALSADLECSAGNTPYFNRYSLGQIQGTSERFRSTFPYKNSDYYGMV